MLRTKGFATVSTSHPFPSKERKKSGSLRTGGLVLVGIGGIIGAGFFLGCGVPIQAAGPAVLLSFLLGGLITSQVTGALTSIATRHPVEGSFKVYADHYIGPFAGFMEGWVYYLTGVITIASEAVAMGVFTKVWLPSLPLWISSLAYSGIIILINAFGVRSFNRVESFMTVVKVAALVGFIVFAVLTITGVLHHASVQATSPTMTSYASPFFAHGFSGVMQSMLVVIFAYAGIGVFATAATKVDNPQTIERGAGLTVLVLTLLYIVSIALLLWIQPWQSISTDTSPFVLAIRQHGVGWMSDLFNAAILIASFSVMAGSVFSSAQILSSLGTAREAPAFVSKTSKRGVAYGALLFTAVGIGCSIGAAYLLPANVYNFLISASSFMTFFYWVLMLWTFLRWRKTDEGKTSRASLLAFAAPYGTWITIVFIIVLTAYALFDPSQRIAFYAFLAVVVVLAVSYRFVSKSGKLTQGTSDSKEWS